METLISGCYNAFSNGFNGAGVYMASGLIPSDSYSRPIYIGSAVNFMRRIPHRHIPELRTSRHVNTPLQCYANKYGLDNLVWFAVETYPLGQMAPSELLEREQYWLNELTPFVSVRGGFNVAEVAGHPMVGRKHTSSARALMSQKRRGEHHPRYGTKHTEETKRLISLKKKGTPSTNKGKRLTKAQKEHLAAVNKGKRHSAETRRKMSESHRRRLNAEQAL